MCAEVTGVGESTGDRAVTIGLIVTELVTNAAKHGGGDAGDPCTIHVRLRPLVGGRQELTVEDDGCGLPDGFDPARSNGLGMRVVRGNVERLGGTMEIGRASEGGTRFAVTFQA